MNKISEREWEEHEPECYYGFDYCVDLNCRDRESCLGCFVIAPPREVIETLEGVY